MYAKLFKSLFEGSMRGQSDVILVWVNLLSHADQEGFVDLHFKAIADETGLPMERVQSAITILEAPDPESRSPELEGRRLERMDEHRAWGWRVVNYAKYRAIRDAEARREQIRQAQERFREKQTPTVINGNHPSSSVINGNQSNQSKPIQIQRQIQIQKNTFAVSDEKPIAQPPKESLKLLKIEFSKKDKEFKNILAEDREKWSKAYPAVNINQELLEMEVWAIANPKNHKSNWYKFITGWLSRSQDKAPGTRKVTWKDIEAREKELARKKREDNKPIPALAPLVKAVKAERIPYEKKAEDCTSPTKAECKSPYCPPSCRFRGVTSAATKEAKIGLKGDIQ